MKTILIICAVLGIVGGMNMVIRAVIDMIVEKNTHHHG